LIDVVVYCGWVGRIGAGCNVVQQAGRYPARHGVLRLRPWADLLWFVCVVGAWCLMQLVWFVCWLELYIVCLVCGLVVETSHSSLFGFGGVWIFC
jgi:hypothetical protein